MASKFGSKADQFGKCMYSQKFLVLNRVGKTPIKFFLLSASFWGDFTLIPVLETLTTRAVSESGSEPTASALLAERSEMLDSSLSDPLDFLALSLVSGEP